ncbi:glycopeptide antibiotics resistance protein [Nakamurella sp. UYEF19]|uniref:VanZ family protein n=1 Tax=Nakamurella sp. UYEF19 TaxID=1756392 RepID=UPI003396F283
MRELWRLFGTELTWIALPVLLVVVSTAIRMRSQALALNLRTGARSLIAVISLIAGAMLFSPVTRTTHARFLDLQLLSTLRSSLTNRIMFTQMVGNLLLLVWLGFLLPIAFEKVRPWMAVVISGLVSIAIETVQYVIAVGRVSSVSDVAFNTVGAAVGAGLVKLILTANDSSRRVGSAAAA